MPYAILDSLLAEYTVGIIPTDFDIANPVGTGAFAYKSFDPGKTSTFTKYADYWGDAGVRRRAADPGLQRRQRQGQRAAGRPDPDGRQPALQPHRHHQGCRRRRAGLRDRRLGAVHDARRRRAVRRRPGAPGDAPDRRPPADDRPDAERLRLARQRHVRAVRRGLRQRPAPARAGHRPGQVAARPRPARRACRSSCSPATTSARSLRRRPTCSSSRPRWPASRSRSPRRRRSTTTTTCPTPSPRTSGTPATTSRRPSSARSRRTRAARTTRRTGTTRSTATSSTRRPRSSTRPSGRSCSKQAQEIEYNEGGLIIWGFRQQVDGYGTGVQGLEPSKYLPLGSYKFQNVSVQ